MSTRRLSIFASRQQREEQKQHDAAEQLRQLLLRCDDVPNSSRGPTTMLSQVQSLLRQYPTIVQHTSPDDDDDDDELPLHIACWKGASLDIVTCLVDAYPPSVRIATTHRRWLPLHYACFATPTTSTSLSNQQQQQQLSVIQYLIQQYHDGIQSRDNRSRLPLHLACFSTTTTCLDTIQFLVRTYPSAVHERDDGGSLPLHLACDSSDSSLDVVQFLVRQWPLSVQEQNSYHSLPLHRACFSLAPLPIIQFLVQQYPLGVRVPTRDGDLPLHLCAASGAPLDVVKVIFRTWPSAVGQTNTEGKTPVGMAKQPFTFYKPSPQIVSWLQQQQEEEQQEQQATTGSGDGDGTTITTVRSSKVPPSSRHNTIVNNVATVEGTTTTSLAPLLPTTNNNKEEHHHRHQHDKDHHHHRHHSPITKQQEQPSSSSSNPQQFSKERERLRLIVQGKRDRPVHVSTKYVDAILSSSTSTNNNNTWTTKGGEHERGVFGSVVVPTTTTTNMQQHYMGMDKYVPCRYAIKVMDRDVIGGLFLTTGNTNISSGSGGGKSTTTTTTNNTCQQVIEQIKNDFKREQRALLHFRHPNIAMLYAYSLSESSRKGHYLLYDLAEKGPLHFFWTGNDLGRERLSYFARRTQIALDVCIGLRFLHVGNKYVKPGFHRDLKSANIALKRDMTAQLLDCGLSALVRDPRTSTSSTMLSTGVRGTRGYVCPKYCTGSIPYDAACDIFSFGVVLAELWSGTLQNHRDDSGRIYNFFEEYIDDDDDEPRNMEDDLDKSLGFGENEDLPDYMYDYKDLALDCMARNPEKRPAGDEVMNRLERIWQECRQDIDDESSVYEEDRTVVDEDAFHESLQTVSNHNGVDESACLLCRTYAKEVGFDECPLCLALNQQRLRIAAAVSSKLDATSTAPASRSARYAMENRSLQNIRQTRSDMTLPVLSRLDFRLNNPIPRLFIIVPADLKDGWKPPRSWLRRRVATRYNLYFICGHSYQAMKPPIKFVASKVWMEKIALSLGVSLTLLQIAARKGFEMSMQLGGSGSSALHVGPDELSEMLTEVKHILDEGDYFDVLARIRSGSRLSDKDVRALNGETYELIVERAREERGWRTVMSPVRKRGDSSVIWVDEAAAEDSRNDYDVIVV